MVPVPQLIFRKIILHGFFKKHPHPHANHLRVRTQTRTWSWVKNLNSKKAPGQYRPRTRRPRRVCRPPCAPYPVLPTLHHYPSGVKNYEGQRRAAPRQPTLHLPCTCHTQRPRAAAVEAAPVRARARSIPRGLFFLPIIPLRPPGRPPHLDAILYTVIFNILTILPLYFVITPSTFRLPSLTTSTRLFLPYINSVNVPVINFYILGKVYRPIAASESEKRKKK